MAFSPATVVDAFALSPRLRRIILQVDDPAALAVKPGGDSAVGVYFAGPSPDGEGRNYSVRHHDGDRITLDVFLHERGIATTWARDAHPGWRVGLDHARSWYRPQDTAQWQLLVTDLSGLPATARIVEELPRGTPATAIVEIVDEDDLDYLPRHPDVTVIAAAGTGNGIAPSRLAALVEELELPAGHGYCWFAGEAAESRTVRKHLRGLGWTLDQMDVTGYWRFDSEAWDARYALVATEVESVWVRARSEGKSERAADEAFDEALERAGL
jgi:NADPH-dependent ferric siderophore reductase